MARKGNKVQKSRSEINQQKKTERLLLAVLVQNTGSEMPIPCSFCKTEKRTCKVLSSKASRCSECIRRKCACNALTPLADQWDEEMPRASDLEALEEEIKKAAAAEELAVEKQREAFEEMVFQKRKQKELSARRLALAERGLRYLDELDALEAKEAEATFGPVASPGVIFDFPSPSASFLEALGAGGETPQAAQGN